MGRPRTATERSEAKASHSSTSGASPRTIPFGYRRSHSNPHLWAFRYEGEDLLPPTRWVQRHHAYCPSDGETGGLSDARRRAAASTLEGLQAPSRPEPSRPDVPSGTQRSHLRSSIGESAPATATTTTQIAPPAPGHHRTNGQVGGATPQDVMMHGHGSSVSFHGEHPFEADQLHVCSLAQAWAITTCGHRFPSPTRSLIPFV